MSDASTADGATRAGLALPFGLQFSLAELFLVALFACVGAAAAKSGGVLAWLFAEATIVLAVAFVVTAIFARRATQAFAVGFIVGVAGHGACLLYFGAGEFEPTAAQLPFSRIVALVWSMMDPDRFVSLTTGKEVPSEAVQSTWPKMYPGGKVIVRAPDGSRFEAFERPPRQDFMLVAHALGAAAAGYLLGKLAAVLYRDRERKVARPGASS